ncbi:hypothetical protein BCF46_1865 [Litoreibacter meonggei]|uniref:histidine kinase n=1 Tax=Litoreibacter meonggei TaxID=1049199 RepID=A0A497W5C8_9RHOB|nr:histidine kinase dimerization/phosphoacceptor domain -containing protein [Litoreibacter meonggei]RLJ51651.1 hypothetical protein BCF46_1865 [Litoreibacter meonggei]
MKTAPWYNSLSVQIVVLLSLALFPLGAVAVYQTNRVAQEAGRNADLALVAVTGRAAKTEELIIERAFGTARFLATIAPDFIENPERCNRDLGKFVDTNQRYSFIGLLPKTGMMTCTSSGDTYDFSGGASFNNFMATPKPTIVVSEDAPLSKQSVFVISEPYEINDKFAGFVTVSIPHSGLPNTPDDLTDLGLEELITFNTDGAVLTARASIEDASNELPASRALAQLNTGQSYAFQASNRLGERRTYTIVPIEGSPATTIGIWRVGDGLANEAAAYVGPSLFPLLMWMASMGVALMSVYLLVLRHVATLRKNMDAFTRDRSLAHTNNTQSMPNELRDLSHNFDRMTENIVQDEANLEDALHEKGVLIKEIHHRVKNNLQLISSIMSMKIRAATEDETKSVLARLQNRVLSLATIHRNLYRSQHGGMVNVGALISEVVEKTFEVALPENVDLDVKIDIEDVLLYPDQAVPLSLLAAEAATNIVKFVGVSAGSTDWVTVSLHQDDRECVLTLANSVGEAAEIESTGLGAELISAFAIQLGGRVEIGERPDRYSVCVYFQAQEFAPESRDY